MLTLCLILILNELDFTGFVDSQSYLEKGVGSMYPSRHYRSKTRFVATEIDIFLKMCYLSSRL